MTSSQETEWVYSGTQHTHPRTHTGGQTSATSNWSQLTMAADHGGWPLLQLTQRTTCRVTTKCIKYWRHVLRTKPSSVLCSFSHQYAQTMMATVDRNLPTPVMRQGTLNAFKLRRPKNCSKFFHLKHANTMKTATTRWNIGLNFSKQLIQIPFWLFLRMSVDRGNNQCGQKLTRRTEVTYCQFYEDVLYEWVNTGGKNHSGNQRQE